ncbi:aldehyde dehydrogenase family protein [Granulicella sp. L60]|jgi:benzaldehyde dehydrogenase (NAD)|uniref:aldehyde dehydrogenase family protein n=1 Tax=Granulicella sp. L60 TaxID=1641866 RepID=UPI00131C3B97|nr:aldehyde dehydrogenase family protein [Granulicella sp. L60]
MTSSSTVPTVQHLMDQSIWQGRLFLNGWNPGEIGVYNVTDKATDEVIANIAQASSGDVSIASKSASAAAKFWAQSSSKHRAAIMRRAGQLLLQHQEEIAYWIIRESGSTKLKAIGEIHTSKEYLDHAADVAELPCLKLLKDDSDMLSTIERIPLGVVGVISPFNFPLALAVRVVAPALASGNAVILKPSLNTAVSGGVVIARVFEEAGLPVGVLHVLPGEVAAGEALVDNANVSMIAFTGSTAAGRQIASVAGRSLKRVQLELGGKNAFLVLSDADLEQAALAGAFSSFFHQGQLCITAGIHLVHESLLNEYSARMAELARAVKVGNPYLEQVGLGPIISDKQLNHVDSIVQEAIQSGAELVEGGSFHNRYYRPTVLKNVPKSSRAFREEIFGPVAAIVGFKEDRDAIQLANNTGYGLVAAVFGEAQHAAEVGKQIEAGMLHINGSTLMSDVNAPFGGTKASGNFTRIGGSASVEEFTTWRWMTETRKPSGFEIPST